MKVNKNQVFNLMDTNGRRKDVVNAMEIYLHCLDETYKELHSTEWNHFPASASEFLFYEKALGYSADVFKQHESYDRIMRLLKYYNAMDDLLSCNKDELCRKMGKNNYDDFLSDLDKNVEARARHFTSNLNKLGFINKDRQISEVGYAILNNTDYPKDELEKLLPINNVNLLYLRQLLKLRIYRNDNSGIYYSPVILGIYILLKVERITKKQFMDIIQGLTPFNPISDIDAFIDDCIQKTNKENEIIVPEAFLTNEELSDDVLRQYFTNAKTSNTIDIYIDFYHLLYSFITNKDDRRLNQLIEFFKSNKSILNKAFGFNKSVFKLKRTGTETSETFLENNSDIDFLTDSEHFNELLYKRFCSCKQEDIQREYSDTLMRLLSVTGIFKFKTGFVELSYKEIFEKIFDHIDINKAVFNKDSFDYENTIFTSNISLIEILGIKECVQDILTELNEFYETGDISQYLSNKQQEDFKKHIADFYPKDTVMEILNMFLDRNNDNKIQNRVNPAATVPTIFEYIVGISWYYLSDENIDLLNSFNLTLSADFEPITHAGGGEGDIIINYDKYVIMLEVTLMNSQAQKRGEWEPVLRHSLNLTGENNPKNVLTFFIASELDFNTINIWRAVSLLELQTTDGTNKTVRNVKIMPLSITELNNFLEKGITADTLTEKAFESYQTFIDSFERLDSDWREDYLKSITDNT